ncbi:MAG: protein phosphatase 2C domain-containing protein, partial [Haloarcula sp.]
MRYSTNYDIGDRKRGQGINEDSVSLTVFEEGHRDGYRGQDWAQSLNPDTADDEAADGTGEHSDTRAENADDRDSSETDGPGRPMNRSAGVFVVADGAGGHDAGDIASYITTTVVAEKLAPVAIRAVRSYPGGFDVDVARGVLPDPPGEQELEAAVAEAITAANREVVRYADETGTQSYTTVVAGIYADGKLHYGWVGDSRAYVVNGVRETISPLTRDHAVVQEWVDSDEIDPVAAHVHPNGNEITRALGGSGYEDPDEATVEVDTRTVRLYAEDTVLATSDGLIDAQTDAP